MAQCILIASTITPETGGYCSVSDVLLEVKGITIDFTDYSAVISRYILQASQEIKRETGKSWNQTTVRERYCGNDGTEIKLNGSPIITLQNCKIYDDSETLLLTLDTPKYIDDSSSTETSPDILVHKQHGLLILPGKDYYIDVSEYPIWTFPAGRHNVEVNYTYGNSTIPEDIKEACACFAAYKALIQQGAKKSGGLSSITVKDVSKSFSGGKMGMVYGAIIDELKYRYENILIKYKDIGVNY